MSILVETGTIGWAIKMLKAGKRVRRAGWSGKKMYLTLEVLEVKHQRQPFVAICIAQGDYVFWVCSQADLLADDFYLVEEESE